MNHESLYEVQVQGEAIEVNGRYIGYKVELIHILAESHTDAWSRVRALGFHPLLAMPAATAVGQKYLQENIKTTLSTTSIPHGSQIIS